MIFDIGKGLVRKILDGYYRFRNGNVVVEQNLAVTGDLTVTGTVTGTAALAPPDLSVTKAKLSVGALAADATGRATMATGFFTEAKATDAFAALAITTGLLKTGIISADAAGRALMATGFFTEAKATDAFAALSITGSLVKAATLDHTKMIPGAFMNQVIADPGTGVALPVTSSYCCTLTTGAGAETNTLAIPDHIGQELNINLGTAGGGTRTITVAAAINQAGNTTIALTQVLDSITLIGVNIAGVLRWRVLANDGCTLG